MKCTGWQLAAGAAVAGKFAGLAWRCRGWVGKAWSGLVEGLVVNGGDPFLL
jgi:hypothetical protein